MHFPKATQIICKAFKMPIAETPAATLVQLRLIEVCLWLV